MRTQRVGSLAQGLVGAWCPSLGATGFRLQDRSGRNNHGTLTNMASTAWVTSGGKGALSFIAAAGHNVSTGYKPSITNPISYSVWFNTNIVNSYRGIVSNYQSNSQAFEIFISNANSQVVGSTFPFTLSTGTNSIAIGNWYHVVVTRGSDSAMFLNGVETSRVTNPSITESANAFRIAQRPDGGFPFDGFIDDIRIYNRALTAPEIRQLYERGRGFGLLPERPRHRSKAAAAAFKAYWARRQSQLIGGGL